MFTGSLLDNLDPFRERSERDVWKALETVRVLSFKVSDRTLNFDDVELVFKMFFICRCAWRTGHVERAEAMGSSSEFQKVAGTFLLGNGNLSA